MPMNWWMAGLSLTVSERSGDRSSGGLEISEDDFGRVSSDGVSVITIAHGSATRCSCRVGGNSSQVRSSRMRPFRFLLTPPHCLKKNGVSWATHWSRMLSTQAGSMGLDFGPDSPPAMTQWTSVRSRWSMGPMRGSRERNLVWAGMQRTMSMRCT